VSAEPENDDDYACTLAELNAGYQAELLAAHGIANKRKGGRR